MFGSCISCHQEPVHVRQALTFQELMFVETGMASTMPNKYFIPAGDAGQALHAFSGFLVIPAANMTTVPSEIAPAMINGKATQLLPAVSIGFFSTDGHLVPVVRDLLNHSDPGNFWQMQVDPGRVWSEPGDNGMSRASFPFILTGDVEGDTWNGIATFLYDERGVSALHYQVVQHSAPYFITTPFIAAGFVDVEYETRSFADRSELVQSFQQELADRTPMRSWSDLALIVGVDTLSGFDAGTTIETIITSGLVIDDVIYTRPFNTAAGEFPYPYGMRFGVWSMSKSMLGMVSMLRLAQKYGAEVFDYRISDYLEVTALHNGWDEVTFGDALNMATGIGAGSNMISPNHIHDGYLSGDQQEYDAWYLALSVSEKLDYVFQNSDHHWGPGEHARYRDRDTFTLSAAMDSLLKRREGPDASVWTMMLEEVYRPIGIHRMSTKFTTEKDGQPGVLFLGWALYVTVDDISKISRLLLDSGSHNGKQLLHAGKLAEALYQTEVRGLPTGNSNAHGPGSYHMSIWHQSYASDSAAKVSIPGFRGWGGMTVDLIPNGIIAYRLKNGGNEGLGMVEVANKIKPIEQVKLTGPE